MRRALPLLAALMLAGPVMAQDQLAITGVNLIAMTGTPTVEPSMTVLIKGERITAIGPTAELAVPENYQQIDGTGRWLIPGLADMHMHFISEPLPGLDVTPEMALSPYLAYGVLQVADLAATMETNILRDRVLAGEAQAPFIVSAAMVDGPPVMRPGAKAIANPEAAGDVVRQIAEDGFDFVKIYSRIDIPTFESILAAAREADIGVIGHIPGGRQTRPEQALLPGFAMVAHAEEFAWRAPEKSHAEIAEIARLMLANGTALTTTLLLDQRILAQTRDPKIVEHFEGLKTLHPFELMLWFEQNPYVSRNDPARIAQLEAVSDFSARLIPALQKAGVPVMAGTDGAFVPGLAPGLSLHEELAALVVAGLTPGEALAAATVAPARWLGVLEDRGTIETGKRANLVLLSADPLADIANSRTVTDIILSGRHFDRTALDALLAELDARYAPYRKAMSPRGAAAIAALND